eukprot:5644860-Pyramimonas_sp.AAC.1
MWPAHVPAPGNKGNVLYWARNETWQERRARRRPENEVAEVVASRDDTCATGRPALGRPAGRSNELR